MSELTETLPIPKRMMKILILKGFVLCTVFILTLGFEFLSNAIILAMIPFFLGKLTFQKQFLFVILLLSLLLIFFYLIKQNGIYFKYWFFILRMWIVLNLLSYLFLEKWKSFEIKPMLDNIYYLHICCIILCSLSPEVNNAVTSIFAFNERETNFRVSGFFSGFDIVSFFILVHLAYEYHNTRGVLSSTFLIKFLFGAFAIFQSGRFGVILMILFVVFIFFRLQNIKWIMLASFVAVVILFTGVLDAKIDNLTSTFKVVHIAVGNLDKVDNSLFEGKDFDGQYNLSPLTWYFEFSKPFKEIRNYLFPNRQEIVDSGPSFFILNFGVFLAFFLYAFYLKIFKLSTKKDIPLLVLIILISADLKFRLFYSLMPLIWLALNHLSYLQQLQYNKN